MRFASHRDVARAIERGVRKAGVSVAYSAGFSPHPRISYSGGAPTGSASEAEYLEISLTRHWEPAHLGRLLDAALPDGIDVVDVVEVDAKFAGLRLEASLWEVLLPGLTVDVVRSAGEAFLAAPTAVVERMTSKGKRQLDARAAVVSLEVHRHVGPGTGAECAILRMVVRQMTPVVRPDDILTALGRFMVLAPASPPVVTRLWQGPLDGLALSPTATARDAVSPAADPQASHHVITSARQAVGSADVQGLAGNQAMRLEAGSADAAPAFRARANEQLSRGERADLDDLRAREPNGRDCPNARDGATKPTARSQ